MNNLIVPAIFDLGQIINIFHILIPVTFLGGAFLLHFSIQGRRKRYIRERESYFRERIPVVNYCKSPSDDDFAAGVLVCGEISLANNYFVNWFSVLKNIFGGELNELTSLTNQAERIAIIRMQEEAEALGAQAICNLRLTTSAITEQSSRRIGVGIQVMASGTALISRQ